MTARSPSLPSLLKQAQSHSLSQCSDRQLLERFTQTNDQTAFAAILDRHGAMLLALCRRLLNDAHLADDVLQATFLVLARKARSIRKGDSLAGWLYGVAQRLARQAHLAEATRSRRERRAADGRAGIATSDPCWEEMLRILDEELQRLPERHRLPLLLCYLEGRTQDEAAKQLGLALRTLRRRLETGRASLRARMTRRGATLGAALFAGFLAPSTARATLTAELRRTVLTTAMSSVNGVAIPASIVVLANGGMRMATIAKLTLWVIVTLSTGGALAGVIWQGSLAKESDEPPEQARQAKEAISPAEAHRKEPAKVPVVLRDRFNDPLPKRALARLGTVGFRHGRVTLEGSLAFTRDGKQLVSTGGGWVRRWELETGSATANLGDGWRQDGTNGTTLATDDGKLARICRHIKVGEGLVQQCTEYDLESGKERTYLLDFPGDGGAHQIPPILSPDGKTYAELNDNGNLTLWNAVSGKIMHQLKGSNASYTAVAFPPDGKTIVVGDDAHAFHVFDLETGQKLRSFAIDKANAVGRMLISPDGKWLVSVGKKKEKNTWIKADDRFLRLWNLETGTVTRTIDLLMDGATESLVFAPDSGTLIAGILDRKSMSSTVVRTWEVASGKPGRAWTDEPTIGATTAVSPDGKTLAAMNQTGVIRLWDMQTGKEKRPRDANPDGLEAVCWTDSKTILTIGGGDHHVRQWEAATGKHFGSPRALQKKGLYPRFAAGGKLLMTNFTTDNDSYLIRVHDPANGKLVLEQPGYWAAFSPDGKRVATSDIREPIQITDRDTGKRIQTVTVDAEAKNSKPPFARPLDFLSNGRSLVVLSGTAETDTLSIWDVLTGEEKSSWSLLKKELLKNPAERHRNSWERIQAVALSPNGSTIAFALLKDGPTDKHGNLLDPFDRIAILETASGKLLHQIDVDERMELFQTIAFSPDGKFLAAGGRWTVRFWNVDTGKEAGKFEGHRGRVTSLAFSPDGKRLASASEDSTVLVWDVAK